ncbi:MAG: ABC transporter substrate-binding protein [Burkholderiales bacterium]
MRLVVFPGGFNWPIWVAQQQGFLAANGVDVQVIDTPGSVFQLSGLIEGRFDLAITLVDNVIAYREGQGEVPIVGDDLCALMAADTRVYPALITAPDVCNYADLRGRTLSVDAKTTGYANVLYAMLESGGLSPGDYAVESVGGVQQRFDAMLAGKQAGALFNSPFEGLLEARGFHRLDTALRVVGRYQGQVLAARLGWAQANRPAVVGFIRAFLDALSWLYDPANREAAFALFARHQPSAATGAAAIAYDVLFGPQHGFPADGRIDPLDLETVIELRGRYGQPKKRLDPVASRYYDSTFLDEASTQ